MIEIEEIEPASCTEALAPEWAALWDRCPAATPFQHPAWMLPWWRHLWGGGERWWIAVRDGGRLAGLAPLFIWGHGTRCVSLAGCGVTDYLDILAEPEHAVACSTLVLDYLARQRKHWDLCDFQELPGTSPVPYAAKGRPQVHDEPCSRCPVLCLPATWSELQSGLTAKFRTDLRRARNRVSRADGAADGASLEIAGPENLDAVIADLFRLHAERWRARGEEGVMDTPALQCFYHDAAAGLMRAGMLRLSVLRVGGTAAAVLFGFAGHGRYYAYLDGFDPSLGRLSPGTVLVSYAVEAAIGEGLQEFDFLREGEAFKYHWGAYDRWTRRVRIGA